MKKEQLKELARTFDNIADGKPWQFRKFENFPDSRWVDAGMMADPASILKAGGEIRLKPWELGRTVNGHTLPDGAEWHRQDFTEDMLPAPYRPLMSGEFIHADDEFDYDQTGRFMSYKDWGDEDAPNCIGAPIPNIPGLYHHRTTRPIKPEPQWLPLGPEDVPIGSVIHDSYGYSIVLSVDADGVTTHRNGFRTFRQLAAGEHFKINRPRHRDADGNPTLWEPCRKEAKPPAAILSPDIVAEQQEAEAEQDQNTTALQTVANSRPETPPYRDSYTAAH